MPRFNLPQREEEILRFWDDADIFKKTLEKDAPEGHFVFYEGPPTANGLPHMGHAETRAFKDCIPRFKTMQGHYVERKAGWDTHGLPVELEIEKKLGFDSKDDIEEFGIDKFNEECKKSVWEYREEWQNFTRRMAYWVDFDDAYVTYRPEYVESIWWTLKQIWEKDFLYLDYRVTPHCPRCGTSLSSHELSQGYKETKDPAVFVKFKVTDTAEAGDPDEDEYLLAWTTTPWTLPANVALAVGPDMKYVKFKDEEGDLIWVAKERVEEVTEGEYEIVEEARGRELVGTKYEPVYPFVKEAVNGTDQANKEAFYVAPADFVSTEDGSGIVHTAVMYGQDDFALGKELDLPKVHLVDLNGEFTKEAGDFAGLSVTKDADTRTKEADKAILKDLHGRELLYDSNEIRHKYPFCWRCKSSVVYYAKDSWYIRMSDLRDELLERNETINWVPDHIQQGRFGEWLREVKDWALSRERYWGTPLPIWECEECDERTCIGSFDELREVANQEIDDDFDPHRPHVDGVEVACGACGGTARRVTDVIDVWFDSGAMPLAQQHYPFENKEKVDSGKAYPADFISEAIDQTRGWFYTMLAISALLGREAPYKNVICLGFVLDAEGKKMSKSKGNVVEPMEVYEDYGADAVRWYLYTINQPGDRKKFDEEILADMIKKDFNTLHNVLRFYQMYTDQPARHIEDFEPTHILDRWMMARMHKLTADVTRHLENYHVTEATRAIKEVINDISTWYVRRSRDRFKGDDEADKQMAVQTLHWTLVTLMKLMAPFTPFLAEDIYQEIGMDKESVHLEDWPTVDSDALDEEVLETMGRVRSIVSRALDKRSEAGINVRQVLSGLTVWLPSGALSDEYKGLITGEVNLHDVFVEEGDYKVELDTELTDALVREGTIREITRRVNGLRKKAGLTIDDTIELYVETPHEEVNKALKEFDERLKTKVQALEVRTTGERPEQIKEFRANEFDIVVGIEKRDE
jgi:isoleucyl-tRNA synthetase